MLFVRMVVLPFFLAVALGLAVLSLELPFNHFELAAFMIPVALMTSGYFGVKAVVQELARPLDVP